MSTLTISGKTLGSRKPLFADWSIPFPPEWSGDGRLTLRDLIDRVVRSEVRAFSERQAERRIFRALTARQIAEQAEKGRVEMGGREIPELPVDEEEAVAVATQAFEDGIYLVLIDGDDQRELDREIYVKPDSQVAFVRLALLAGG